MHYGPPLSLFPSAPALEQAGLCSWEHVLGTLWEERERRKGRRVRGEGGDGKRGKEEKKREEAGEKEGVGEGEGGGVKITARECVKLSTEPPCTPVSVSS